MNLNGGNEKEIALNRKELEKRFMQPTPKIEMEALLYYRALLYYSVKMMKVNGSSVKCNLF